MARIIDVDDNSFAKEVLQYTDAPVLVKFSAVWCGPCKIMALTTEQVAQEWDESLRFVAIDIDQAREVATQLQIRSVPTLMLFNQGELIATSLGALKKPELEAFINQHL